MLIESTGAIQQASQATGTSFNYLLVESGLNPHAARRHRGRAGYSSSQRSDRQFGHGRSLHQGQRSVLSQRLGRQPSEGELYIAHFLGAGGAARSITLASAHPNAKAADFFASAAQANSPISYDRATGAARSVAQVRNVLTARYDVARCSQDRQTLTAQAVTAPTPASCRSGYRRHCQRLHCRGSHAQAERHSGVSRTVLPTPTAPRRLHGW